MARDGNGNWVPLTPVVGGTTIESAWANGMMTSFGQDVTESLDRYGRGGMVASFTLVDGNASEPGWAFTTEPNTGMRRSSAAEVILGILGTGVMRWQPNTAAIWTGSAWETIITSGTPGQVGVTPGTTDGDTLEWNSGNWVISSLKMVPAGTADQTLRWDDTAGAWAVTSGLSVDETGNVDMTAALSVIGGSTLGGVTLTGAFDGGTQVLTNIGDPADAQDAVTKAFADANYGSASGTVPTTRTLTAGAGLTGGGDLSADRTFNVGAGTGITVAADTVAFDEAYGDGRYAPVVHTHTAAQITDPENINAGQVDGKSIAVVASLPGTPDANTIYFVTG